MPRQNGKGDEIEVVELWGLVQRSEAILHTVHDAVLLASQTQQRMLGVLEGHADLRRLVKRKWQGTGQQMIEMRNGGVIWYRTRTGGGGRGVDDISRLVVDEAQHATEEQLAAVSPTLLANPNPQLNAMGTAGLAGISRWWWSVRKRALSSDPGAFGYVGHTAENVYLDDNGVIVQEPIDPSDRSLWPGANPALSSGRGGGMAFLEEQFRRLPDMFAGEHLGAWEDPPAEERVTRWALVPEPAWKSCADGYPLDQPGWLDGQVTLCVEQDDRRTTWICAAGDVGDRVGGDVVARIERPDQVAPLLLNLISAGGVKRTVVDRGSRAASLVQKLSEAGIEVTEFSTAQAVRAAGQIINAISSGGFAHRNRPELTEAASLASSRKVGDAEAIDRWSGQNASAFIGVALAHAGHLLVDELPKKQPGRYW